MPLYELICDKCKYFWEERLTFAEFDNLSTKQCLCGEVGQIHTNAVHDILYAKVKEITTIGALAEQNTKRRGRYKNSEIEAKARKKEPKSDWTGDIEGKKYKEIISIKNSKTRKQAINKYIMEGK
jgi:hypothetical protein